MAGAEEQERLTPEQDRRRRQAAEEARKKERALRRQRLRLLMEGDPEKQKEMQEKNPDLVPSQHEMEWVCSLRSRKLKSASFQERSTQEDDDASDLSPTGPLTTRSTASSTVSAFSSNSTVSYSRCASNASGRSRASSISTSSTTSGTRAATTAATSAATSFSLGPAHGEGVGQAQAQAQVQSQAGGGVRFLRRTHSLEAANEIRMMLDGESPSRLAADVARTSPSQIVSMAPAKQQSPARRPRVPRSISATSANEPMGSGDIWGRSSGNSHFNARPPGIPQDHRREASSTNSNLGRNQTIPGFDQPQGAGYESNRITAGGRSFSGNSFPSPDLNTCATSGPRSGGSPVVFRRFGSFGHSPSRFAQEEQCSREGQNSGRPQGRCPAPRMPTVARSSPAKRS